MKLTAGLATLIAGAAWVAFKVIIGQAPWSSQVSLLGDMGNQSAPLLAYYRDVLTGDANGDLLFAWGMSYGQSFVGDFAFYLANPLNLLVVVFPRANVPQALLVVQIVMGALTAGSMSLLLSTLRPGWRWLNVALAVGWGTLPFLTLDAGYHPYFGVGPMVLPLMIASAIWVRDGHRTWAVAIVFAVAFLSSFYAGYMASLGAGLVVLALVAAEPDRWPRPLATMLAWVGRATLGAAMSAILVLPTYFAAAGSARPSDLPFNSGFLGDWLAAVLPAADTIGLAPSWSPGPAVLVVFVMGLAAAAPRPALTWGGALSAVLLSLAWQPTSLLWHGGDVPNGNFFRQAWVPAAIVVIGAWQLAPALAASLSRAGGWRGPLLAVGAMLALVIAATPRADVVTPSAAVLGVAVIGVVAAAVILRGSGSRVAAVALLAMIAATMLLGRTAAYDHLVARSNVVLDFDELPSMRQAIARALALGHDTNAGAAVTQGWTMNDPLLLGGTGATGYSTLMPRRTSEVAGLAGAKLRAGGRRAYTLGTALEHAVFGVRQRTDPTRSQARWLPAGTPEPAAPSSPLEFYASHLDGGVARVQLEGVAAGSTWTGTAACPPTTPILYRAGTAELEQLTVDGKRGVVHANAWVGEVHPLTDRPGPWEVTIRGVEPFAPARLLMCAAEAPRPQGVPAVMDREGHRFSVQASSGSAGALVIGTAYTPEWSCRSTDGEPALDTYDHAGLLGIRAGGRATSCTFEPRGLAAGAWLSGAALLLALALGVRDARRRG